MIRFFVRNNFYVLIDNHLNLDSTAIDNPTNWVALWKQLMTDVVADEASAQRVMVDILNEPDSRGVG